MTNSYFIILLFIAYLLSVFGTIQYRKFAINHKILANINNRTLHNNPIPRGGGIVFSIVFIFFVLFFYLINVINLELFLVFGIGAGLSTIIGKGAYIGSGCNLVAPLIINQGSTIGAGSTITQNTPSNLLTLARSKQIVVKSWKRLK